MSLHSRHSRLCGLGRSSCWNTAAVRLLPLEKGRRYLIRSARCLRQPGAQYRRVVSASRTNRETSSGSFLAESKREILDSIRDLARRIDQQLGVWAPPPSLTASLGLVRAGFFRL
jgi:hypothetical protein